MSQGENVTYGNRDSVTGGALSAIAPDQRADALRGAQILAKALQSEGVDVLFGYPGGANLEIFDVLPQYGIRCIRTEHEQGAAHAAQGYARVTGRPGVCLATSGPGATNLVTGIADANSDSTPLVAITGNVPSHLLGKNAFQEVDIVAVTEPITKRNYLVKRVADIPSVVREAFALAAGTRPGPVLIDIPKDIQQQYPRDPEGNYAAPRIPAVIDAPEPAVGGLERAQLEECVRLISDSERPVIYAGGGISAAGCEAQLLMLAEKVGIPVTWTIMGVGCFPPEHGLALDVLGMHGARYANRAIFEADLVLALGVRFDDRVTGNLAAFARNARIIHIDIDRRELNKNKTVTLPICADLKPALEQLVAGCQGGATAAWCDTVANWRAGDPYPEAASAGIGPQQVIRALCEATDGEAIVSLGVGQHQMWAMQHYRSSQSRSFLSSSGFGTMGYGLPAAIGAKVAAPERQVIDIDGDGSLNMTVHELSTCHRYGLGVKVVVINNQWLGMVRQWQDMIYDRHRAESDLSDPLAVKDAGANDVYPDFLAIAAGYRVRAERVSDPAELSGAIERLLQDPNEPFLLDVIVDAEANVFPMIPAGGSFEDIIMNEEDLAAGSSGSQGSNI